MSTLPFCYTSPGVHYHLFRDASAAESGAEEHLFLPSPTSMALQSGLILTMRSGLRPVLIGPPGAGKRMLLRHLAATAEVHDQNR